MRLSISCNFKVGRQSNTSYKYNPLSGEDGKVAQMKVSKPYNIYFSPIAMATSLPYLRFSPKFLVAIYTFIPIYCSSLGVSSSSTTYFPTNDLFVSVDGFFFFLNVIENTIQWIIVSVIIKKIKPNRVETFSVLKE